MNKRELVAEIRNRMDFTWDQATSVVDAVFDTVEDALKSGETVNITGWGRFTSRNRPARSVRNPQTGSPVMVAAKNVVRFKAGKELLRSLNS